VDDVEENTIYWSGLAAMHKRPFDENDFTVREGELGCLDSS